MPQPQIAKKH